LHDIPLKKRNFEPLELEERSETFSKGLMRVSDYSDRLNEGLMRVADCSDRLNGNET